MSRAEPDVEYSAALWIKRLGERRGLSAEDREDLAQEARVAAWRAAQTFDPTRGASRATWIIGAIKHAVLDGLRDQDHLTRGQRHMVETMAERPAWSLRAESLEHLLGAEDAALEALTSPPGLVEEEALRRLEARRVRAAVRHLPPRWAAVVRLRHLEERPRNESARLLGISESAYDLRLRAGHDYLRALLEEEGP